MTDHYKKILSLALVAFIFLGSAGVSRAEDSPDASQIISNPMVKEVGESYVTMTYPGLFRLAWGFGFFKTSDKAALDTYLKVSECNLYKKYYKNEFEWEKVRTATKAYLDKYSKKRDVFFEYVQPLELGRYDNELEGFPLLEADKYISLKTLQIADFIPGETECGPMAVDKYKYPASATLKLISPLSLTFIRVSKDLAKDYLLWRTKEGLQREKERQAYIRFRVRIDDLNSVERIAGKNALIFDGRLMQIDVFADQEMMMPLYNQLF